MISANEMKELQNKIFLDGDQHTYAQLYLAYMPCLLRFARSIIKNNELSEDAVQLYTRDMVGSITRPVKELKSFQKIESRRKQNSGV